MHYGVTYGLTVKSLARWERVRHTLTHFHMEITPWLCHVVSVDPGLTPGLTTTNEDVDNRHSAPSKALEALEALVERTTLWYNPRHALPGGVAAPVARLLACLGVHPTAQTA